MHTILPDWTLARESINTGGITKLKPNLYRYVEQARHVQPVVCVADTDGRCPVDLVQQWLPGHTESRFVFRLAVTEAESWLLADHATLAEFLAVPVARMPDRPDELVDPKRVILGLARRSGHRWIRDEVGSSLAPDKRGNGYNLHLVQYVRKHWRPTQAAEQSPSIARAIRNIGKLAELAT
ncbi:MAG: hypothetical protein IPI44_15045 [Sulfuritalea sp.]|nr:hypothetical protein [Sulfuritalea sp.]